jgi:hypothetical protein
MARDRLLRKALRSAYGAEPVRGSKMSACDAAGLGRKIEVEGKKYDLPARCLIAITSFRL